ncbi:MAG: phosphoribosylaminoimidazolecarboxamide formyltransferase, 5-formaminoimidazole-4-carboxamide-1-(beta)-D-ribofuranosyl 5'-monophosphate synthetase [Candidatus Peregrinibacteria bacterium GW2011_GWF2_38_29]|nr:MAG: phosphoribosylaminoimidazolecarboxamide formyltransferase, 5-formaminoimidazole-4-carboxamide-1-(beta)-D-ribofuranosyl 5'-monophosphate synthetase [Candidatus Peregrinibacteria bacterium GW2011_GWF2_38_29]HBB02304.1 5-formaminoimidazole-4-carboxamide-1-(beta)-D-ribofuranosyl 5'-monophosphate synthetase [Candidatus Peregrinibacteria bacterium]
MTKKTSYKIATLGSHTALQILKGAHDEGFKTICICRKDNADFYKSYKFVDEIILVDNWTSFFKIEDRLIKENAILIPHGSFVSYIKPENVEKIKVMHYGTKGILEWESDRRKERKWLQMAKINTPKIYEKPEDIDRPVIVKFHGALGGKGYFIANNPKEFHERIKEYPNEKDYALQEYVVGVPLYIHYFHSSLTGELEIMSFDKRYESNADSIGRIAAKDQLDVKIRTSYTITGNMPLVVRESLLPEMYEMGKRVVEASKKLVGKGLFGPFCLETIVDPDLKFYVFEISARIVAGTNPYINGSPYTWLKYDVPMSTGRRIALEIKRAIKAGKLEKILG